MHGAGNDFVIVDARQQAPELSPARVALLADRHRGIGFDQLILIQAPRRAAAVAAYAILNADGSPAAQCGNGARCVAAWLLRAGAVQATDFVLDSPAGPVRVQAQDAARIGLELGVPDFSPQAIGLALPAADPYRLCLDQGEIAFGAVSMGNPHVLIEVADVARAEVARLGAHVQALPLFTQGCNVGFAQVLGREAIALRVFERGAGETLACGSGACAAVAILARRGRVGPQVAVSLPGGTLHIHWPGEGRPVHMAGPARFVFEGECSI